MSQREYLIEMVVRTDGAGTLATLTYSVFGFNSEPSDALANRHYAPRIVKPGVLSMSLYAPNATTGQSRVGFGGVVLANTDGALDALIDYGFSGGTIRILAAPRGSRYSQFTVLLTGIMEQAVFSWDSVTVAVRDRQNTFATTKVQTAIYAGTNSGSPLTGAEGTANDIRGRRKPVLYGKVNNVRAVCVNTDRNIYQVSDAAVNVISAVYVAGVAKTVGTVYSDYATMESTAPTAGQFRALPGSGLFRIDAATNSDVTADVTQGASTANRTAAQIMQAIALRIGIASGDISATDVTALDAACPQELGVFLGSEETASTAMDMVASSVGAWWAFDLSGVLRFGRFILPTGSSVATFDSTNIIGITRRSTNDEGRGVPAWRVRAMYSRNWTQQSSGLASGVTAARRAYLESEGLFEVASDSGVLTQFPLSPEMTFPTLLTNSGDAATEASRLLTIYKARRDMIELRTRLELANSAALRVGSVVTVALPRYGLGAGKNFTVIGYVAQYDTDTVTLTLWG